MSLLSPSNARDTQPLEGVEVEETVPFVWLSGCSEPRLAADVAPSVDALCDCS